MLSQASSSSCRLKSERHRDTPYFRDYAVASPRLRQSVWDFGDRCEECPPRYSRRINLVEQSNFHACRFNHRVLTSARSPRLRYLLFTKLFYGSKAAIARFLERLWSTLVRKRTNARAGLCHERPTQIWLRIKEAANNGGLLASSATQPNGRRASSRDPRDPELRHLVPSANPPGG